MAKGDHLYVHYPGFTHHGIDLGDGTVIDYGGKRTRRMTVRRGWRGDFVARGRCFVKYYPLGMALHPDETIELAWERLRERDYNLFDNNCEHFAYWCKTGDHWSPQADNLKGILLVGAAVAVIALLAQAMR